MWLENDVVRDLDKVVLADISRKIGLSDLQDGEIICDECQGHVYNSHLLPRFDCFKCDGAGKLDWIENIVGKNL